MFCPKCSQQQISDEVRFCSRCGFQLGVVAKLLSTDGILQNLQPESPEELSLFRQITSRVGAKLMFLSVISFPFIFLLAASFNAVGLFLIPLILFVIGFTQVSYLQLFGWKKSAGKRRQELEKLNASELPFELPSPNSIPVSFFEMKDFDTAEMISPSSVTDHTTKLLELNAESPDRKR